MDLGQRVYLPGCRRIVCKIFAGRPILEEQFCDALPEKRPSTCVIKHRPHKRHPDCCPKVICAPRAPNLIGGKPAVPQVSPERRYHRVPSVSEVQDTRGIINKPAFKSETYESVLGYPNKSYRPVSVAVTSPSFITSEIIYGKGYSDPWDGGLQLSTETIPHQVHENHRYEDPALLDQGLQISTTSISPQVHENYRHEEPPLWGESSSFALDPLSNNISVLEASDSVPAYRQGIGSDLLDEIEQGEVKSYLTTPAPQDFHSTTQQTGISYWHFTEANDVRTSPHPFRDYSDLLPISKLFSTSRFPTRNPETTPTTDPALGRLSNSYTPWRPITRIETAYPYTKKKKTTLTTPNWGWTSETMDETIQSLSTRISEYFSTKNLDHQTTPVYPSTRSEQKKTYISTKPTSQFRATSPAYNVYTRTSRQPTHHVTKRPGANKIPTPRPNVEFTRTTPASYEFATPKLNPAKHDIHEFILTPLDPSELIPGHDVYVQAKYDAMREYFGSEEKLHSKKNRRSLPYTETTLPYEYSTTALPRQATTHFEDSTTALPEQPETSTSTSITEVPTTVRQKRGRPVFYIPWRENLVSQSTTPSSNAENSENEDSQGVSRTLPSIKIEVLSFDQSDTFKTPIPVVQYTNSRQYTNVDSDTSKPYYNSSKVSAPSDKQNFYFDQMSKETKENVTETDLHYETDDELKSSEDYGVLLEELTTTPATTLATLSPTTEQTAFLPEHPQHRLKKTTPLPEHLQHKVTEQATFQPEYPQHRLREQTNPLPEDLQHTFTAATIQLDTTDAFQPDDRELGNDPREADEDDNVSTSDADAQKPQRKIVWSPPPFRPSQRQNPSTEITKTHIQESLYSSLPEKEYMGLLLYEPRKEERNPASDKSNAYEARTEGGSEFEVGVVTVRTPPTDPLPEREDEGSSGAITSHKLMIADTKTRVETKQSESKVLEKDITTEYRPNKIISETFSSPFNINSRLYATPANTFPSAEEVEDFYNEAGKDENKNITDLMTFEKIKDTQNEHKLGLDLKFQGQQEMADTKKDYSLATPSGQNEASSSFQKRENTDIPHTNRPMNIATLPLKNWYGADYNDFSQEDVAIDLSNNDERDEGFPPKTRLHSMLKLSKPSEPTAIDDGMIAPPFPDGQLSSSLSPTKEIEKTPRESTTNYPKRRSSLIASRTFQPKSNLHTPSSPLSNTTTANTAKTKSRFRPAKRPSQLRGPHTQPSSIISRKETLIHAAQPSRKLSNSRLGQQNRASSSPEQSLIAEAANTQEETIRLKSRDRLPPGTFTRKETTSRTRGRRPTQARRLSRVTTPVDPLPEPRKSTEPQTTTNYKATVMPQAKTEPYTTVMPLTPAGPRINKEPQQASNNSEAEAESLQIPVKPRRITSFTYKTMIHGLPRSEPDLREANVFSTHSALPVISSVREASVSVELPDSFLEHSIPTTSEVPVNTEEPETGVSPQVTRSPWEPLREE
ncbi:mucin-2-like [Cherax quadricarinatus]|uniref:mucin-2-like n=1 Tax=Cherax quadricarinatus TaxID=27406 RepID=UPI00387E7CBE